MMSNEEEDVHEQHHQQQPRAEVSPYDLTLMEELQQAIEKSRQFTDKLAAQKDSKMQPKRKATHDASSNPAPMCPHEVHTAVNAASTLLLPAASPSSIRGVSGIHRTHSDSRLHVGGTTSGDGPTPSPTAASHSVTSDDVRLLNEHMKQLLDRVYQQEVELSKYKTGRESSGDSSTNQTPGTDTSPDDAASWQHTRHAELVAELYEANRRRDVAMLARLTQVNGERQAALTRLRTAQDTINWYMQHHQHCPRSSSPPVTLTSTSPQQQDAVREEVEHLLSCTSPRALHRHAAAALSGVTRCQDTSHRAHRDEMVSVVEDRDEVRGQCARLEHDLEEVRRGVHAILGTLLPHTDTDHDGTRTERDGTDTDTNNTATTTSTAQILTHLRDIKMKLESSEASRRDADKRVEELRAELSRLRLYYSLHGSLSDELELTEQYNSQLSVVGAHVMSQAQVMQRAQVDNNTVLGELRQALSRNDQLHDTLHGLERDRDEARDECNRLQRLVTVLRKKVNTMGVNG